jgi:hypothetical protein
LNRERYRPCALRAQVGALAVHNGPGEPGRALSGNALVDWVVRSLRWRVPLWRDTFAPKVIAVVETIHRSARLRLQRGFRDDANLPLAGNRGAVDPRQCARRRDGRLGDVGETEEAWVRDAAAKLIVEAYSQGARDEDVLAHYALKSLARGRRGF